MPSNAAWTLTLSLAIAQGAIPRAPDAPPTEHSRQPATEPQPGWPSDSAAYASLRALDAAATGKPVSPAPDMAGINLEELAPLGADDPAQASAQMPLDQALATCIASTPAPSPAEQVAEGARVRAQRLYASGVAHLLDGDLPGASRDLSGAAKLDPGAPAPWLRLGDAQAAVGQNAAALLSYKRAVDLGSDSPVALGVLGVQASSVGQQSDAANYLARCLAANPEAADPWLTTVALAHIAGPLRRMGYLRASIEALQGALEPPRRLGVPSRFGEAAADIFRRSADLWRDMGDAACRLGDDELASRCYERAATLPSLDPSSILVRRAYVLLRSGRAPAAALLLLDDVAARGGRADARHMGLLSTLRNDDEVGPLTIRALDDLAASLPRPLAPSTASAIALAKAAPAPDPEARAILLSHLREQPRDRTALATLMARLPRDDDRAAVALELVAQSPQAAPEVADLLGGWHAEPAALIEKLPETPPARLLRAWLLIGWSRASEAIALGGDALEREAPAEAETWELSALGVGAAMAGRWDMVDQVLRLLPDQGFAAAEVLRAAQRYPEALHAMEPLLGDDATIAALLRGSELALGAGDTERSEALLRRAQTLDPFQEGAYEGLLAVYQGRADERRAGDVVRELRTRVPSSHLLRWANAQELAQRGQLDESERSLRDLVADSPDNPNSIGLLLQIWQQRSRAGDRPSLEEAEAWLRRRATARPFLPEATSAWARVLAWLDRQDEALQLAETALNARPSPTLARVREDLLRERGDAQRADALALERLEAAGRGIDASLERAEILARSDHLDDAASRLRDAMPAGATLTASQRNRLLGVLTAVAGPAADGADPDPDVLALLSEVERFGVQLSWQLRFARWTLLSRDPSAPEADVAAAASGFVASIPSLEVARSLIRPSPGQRRTPIGSLDEARAEIAYEVANALFTAGRADASLETFGLALRYNPAHVWAANDLGYFLLERGERLDEAARLLETAFAGAPGEANVADSLGWLRYKLGQLRDQTQADGSTDQGAISLLTTATTLPGGESNPTIFDHLGDALWRAGDTERAQAMWLRAQQLLFDQLTQLRAGTNDVIRRRLTEAANLTGSKLDAVRAGKEPQVAPLVDE